MSDTAWDRTFNVDYDPTTGTVTRKAGVATHLEIQSSEWAAARAAASLGLTDFDSWVASSSKPSAVKSWFAGLSTAHRDGIRLATLYGD